MTRYWCPLFMYNFKTVLCVLFFELHFTNTNLGVIYACFIQHCIFVRVVGNCMKLCWTDVLLFLFVFYWYFMVHVYFMLRICLCLMWKMVLWLHWRQLNFLRLHITFMVVIYMEFIVNKRCICVPSVHFFGCICLRSVHFLRRIRVPSVYFLRRICVPSVHFLRFTVVFSILFAKQK